MEGFPFTENSFFFFKCVVNMFLKKFGLLWDVLFQSSTTSFTCTHAPNCQFSRNIVVPQATPATLYDTLGGNIPKQWPLEGLGSSLILYYYIIYSQSDLRKHHLQGLITSKFSAFATCSNIKTVSSVWGGKKKKDHSHQTSIHKSQLLHTRGAWVAKRHISPSEHANLCRYFKA